MTGTAIRTNTALALVCAAIALLAAVTAGLGVFARGDGAYQTVTSVRGVTYEVATSGVYAWNAQRIVAEGVGWDVFTLFVVGPALAVTAIAVARGSFRGRLVALGLLGYVFYQYLEYAMTWALGPLFPAFIVLFGSSLIGIVWLAAAVARDGVAGRFQSHVPVRAFSVVSVTMAVLLALMWTRRIATALGGDLEAAGLRGETTLVVQALDLGLVVPAALLISWQAWRRTAAGLALAAVYVVTSIAMSSAIVAMLVSAAVVEGTLEIAPVAIFSAYVVASAAIAIRVYRGVAPAAGARSREPGAMPRAQSVMPS
jgi:hypothetical protein